MTYSQHTRHGKTRRHILKPVFAAIVALTMMGAGTAYADVGFDAASYQGCYNAQAAVNDGARFSFIKITQGNYYTNPYRDCQFKASRNAGLRLGAYGFADTAVSPQADAALFNREADRMGLIGTGVIPVLDWEPSNPGNVTWAKTWLDIVAAHWGTKPLIYMSANTIHIADWTPVSSADYGLWVAGYPRGYAGDRLRNPGSVPYSVSPWKFAAAWQYSSSGSVAGVGSAVDVDWFYGDAATWAKYANAPVSTVTHPAASKPTVTVKPVRTTTTPKGDANALATAVIQGLYGNQPQRQKLLGSRYAEVMAIVNRRLMGRTASAPASYYIVRSGDYLSKVWPNNWRTIAALNGLRSPYVIYPGQRLRTSGATASTGRRSLIIGPGDTLWAHFGANSANIARANGISNPNRILAGTRIYY